MAREQRSWYEPAFPVNKVCSNLTVRGLRVQIVVLFFFIYINVGQRVWAESVLAVNDDDSMTMIQTRLF